ncbi:MAG: putative BsuMI modification methylase subunit YdiP [Firmicutes bacterium]|nr:putative BsuMI modification methylase subunit YdiP [Bacillota bacterium]
MKFLSVCSGIEAVSLAWRPLGFEAAAFSEIDKFPCAVLAHHYPQIPNLGDMTQFKEWPDYEFDILVGGTPCQSFSVAGLRKGLADPRGNLTLTFLAIAERCHPRWVVWENVPGVLSSGRGRDFGAFLGALGELGYGWAYRTLDAQYFGVPQRRRRVFVIGYFGDWRRAAAVLFEHHSLQRHPAPSREAGESFTHSVASGFGASGRGFARGGKPTGQDCVVAAKGPDGKKGKPQELAHATTAHQAKGGDPTTDNYVVHSLRAEDGTGRGTPLVPIAFNHQDNYAFRASTEVTNPLRANQTEAIAIQAGASKENPAHGPSGAGVRTDGQAYTLEARAEVQGVAFMPARSLAIRGRGGIPSAELGDDKANAILTPNGGRAGIGVGAILRGMQVRRLTPTECARLQGFPDNYLDITYRGKPAADGPKYKALGNSMAVPVVRWLGERLQLTDWLFMP